MLRPSSNPSVVPMSLLLPWGKAPGMLTESWVLSINYIYPFGYCKQARRSFAGSCRSAHHSISHHTWRAGIALYSCFENSSWNTLMGSVSWRACCIKVGSNYLSRANNEFILFVILQIVLHFLFVFLKTPEERYARFKNLRIITVKKVSGYFLSLPRF